MIDVKKSDRWALDGLSPIRHVVTALVGAQRALTISEFDYKHINPGDINRVKSHEGVHGDRAANEWLIKWAITQLGPEQIEEVDGERYQLKIPHEEVKWQTDNKVYNVYLNTNDIIWSGGNEPFSELNGEFHFNIEIREKEDDTSELRESLRTRGWNKYLRGIKDENGVVLVGNRRLAIAQELGIQTHFDTITFGKDPQADAERLGLAIDSNTGGKPRSAASRRRLAKFLYGKPDWSMEDVAKALRVTERQVYRDLKTIDTTSIVSEQNENSRFDKLGRKIPSGRKRTVLTEEQVAQIIQLIAQGVSQKELVGQFGHKGAVEKLIIEYRAEHRGRRALLDELESKKSDTKPIEPEEVVEPEEEKEISEHTTASFESEPIEEPEPVICEHVWKQVCSKCGIAHP